MPTLRWRRDRGRWQLDYIDDSGKRRRPFLPEETTEAQARKHLDRLTVGSIRRQARGPSFRVVAEEWHAAGVKRWAPSTMQWTRTVLDRYLLPVLARRAMGVITTADLERLLDQIEINAPGQAIVARKAIKTVFNHGVRYGHIGRSPAERLAPRGRTTPPRYLTRDEYDLALRVANPDVRDAIIVAVRTGVRQGELVALKGDDWQGARLVIARQWDRRGKRIALPKCRKARSVPVHGDVAKIFRRRIKRHGNGWLWPRGEARAWSWWEYGWKWLAKGTDLPTGTHVLRHTFAAWWVQAGGGMKELQAMLGHASIKTTEIYAHLAPDSVDLAARRVWGRVGTRGDGVAPQNGRRRNL